MNVFVIIPVHNRLHLTRACLASLGRQTMRDFTVVVVDDGSSDGTSDALAKDFPTVRVLTGDGSLWWTGAMNVGVRWALARAEPDDVVLSLNNDTIPPREYLEGLLRAHATAPESLVGSLLVSAKDESTIVDGGVTLDWATAKYRAFGRGGTVDLTSQRYPRLRRTDVLSGRGTLIPVRVFRLIGVYDEVRLKHYAADYEFARRALRGGFGLFVDWASPLPVWEAETGAHVFAESAEFGSLLRSFWDTRSANDFLNRWRFALAACPRWALPMYVPCDYARVVIGSIRRYRARRPPRPGTASPARLGLAERARAHGHPGGTA